MSHVQTQARIETLAQKMMAAPLLMAFPWTDLVRILQELVPVIISCFRPADGTEAQAYVARHYSSRKGYDPRLVKRVARAALQSSWRKHRIRLTYAQAVEVATKTLDDIRTADVQQTSIVIRETDDALAMPLILDDGDLEEVAAGLDKGRGRGSQGTQVPGFNVVIVSNNNNR